MTVHIYIETVPALLCFGLQIQAINRQLQCKVVTAKTGVVQNALVNVDKEKRGKGKIITHSGRNLLGGSSTTVGT